MEQDYVVFKPSGIGGCKAFYLQGSYDFISLLYSLLTDNFCTFHCPRRLGAN